MENISDSSHYTGVRYFVRFRQFDWASVDLTSYTADFWKYMNERKFSRDLQQVMQGIPAKRTIFEFEIFLILPITRALVIIRFYNDAISNDKSVLILDFEANKFLRKVDIYYSSI